MKICYLKQMKKQIKVMIIIVAILVLLLLLNSYFQPLVSLRLSLSPIKVINETELFALTLAVESKKDLRDVSGEIILPENFELVEGDLQWKADLQKNKPEIFNIIIKPIRKGEGIIKVSTEDNSVYIELITRVGLDGETKGSSDKAISIPFNESKKPKTDEPNVETNEIELSEEQKILIEQIIMREDPEVLEKTSFFVAEIIPEEPNQLKLFYIAPSAIPESPHATIIIDLENEIIISIEKSWWDMQ